MALVGGIGLGGSGGGGGGTTIITGNVNTTGKQSVAIVRIDYSGTPVSTGAYTTLVASLASNVTQLFIFDSSGQTLVIATGPAASEVDQVYITPGGNGELNLAIPAGTRVSVRAISANATVGELNVAFLN